MLSELCSKTAVLLEVFFKKSRALYLLRIIQSTWWIQVFKFMGSVRTRYCYKFCSLINSTLHRRKMVHVAQAHTHSDLV